MKKLAALFLALALCLSSAALAEETGPYYRLGDVMEDFTVTACDGRTVSLSALLKEKDMVLLNLWATWCGPCQREFPAMEAAYEQFQDRVAIVALSIDPSDTDAMIASFVQEFGMTFYVGHDEYDFSAKFAQEGIPTSVIIDRNSIICYIECGSMPVKEQFTTLFDLFVGDGYGESLLLTETPRMRPSVTAVDPALLAAALGTENAANPEDAFVWPWLPAETDGRETVVPGNQGAALESSAAFSTVLTAAAGDAIAVTAQVDTASVFDALSFGINGETVKGFSGSMGWFTYALPVETDGDIVLTVTYRRNSQENYEETVCVDSISLLSGDEAAAALASNPVYPVSDAISLTPVSESAREIIPSQPDILAALTGVDGRLYIIPEETAEFIAAIDASIDPDVDFFYLDYDGRILPVRDTLQDGAYRISSGTDDLSVTGYAFTDVFLYHNMQSCASVMFFRNEENADYFFDVMVRQSGPVISWAYADESEASPDALPADQAGLPLESHYVVKYVDQDGNPVAGVICQVCDDQTCTLFTSDENGECAFTLAPYAWEIHTLRIPAGYAGDTAAVTIAPAEGGELVFTLTRN